MSKPKIRFNGFTEDWEQRKLGELGNIMTGSTPSTSHEEYYSDDGIPWVTPTDIETNLISDTPRKLSKDGEKVGRVVPANTILVTCIASIGKNALLQVKGSFNQQINSLTPNDKNDPYFLLTESALWSEKMKKQAAAATMQIVNKTEFSEIETYVPCKEEQCTIGIYFEQLDHLITLHQRKWEQTKKLKKFMLQKMFPQNGKSVPEIRFNGFTEDWEQRKFGTMFKRRMERNNGQFDNTRWISVAKMYFQEPDKVTSNNIDTRTYVMRRGDIAFEGHSNAEYKYGRFVANDIGDGIISELFPIYMHIDDYDEAYWKYAIQIEEIMASKLLKCIEISYTSSNKLDEDFFLKEEILVPSLDEQQQIGTYFRNLDHLITLHQRKCDELQNMKKFMLQNMFV